MTLKTNNTAPATNALTALRAVGARPPGSITEALRVAERQAQLFRDLLPQPTDRIAICLTDLIPTIHIDYIDAIPLPVILFRARSGWHIHVRADVPADLQIFAVLRQLKHIIDRPLRRENPYLFSDVDWDALANRFAACVLADRPQIVAA